MQGEHLLRGGEDGLGRLQREQRAGVAEAQLSELHVTLHGFW